MRNTDNLIRISQELESCSIKTVDTNYFKFDINLSSDFKENLNSLGGFVYNVLFPVQIFNGRQPSSWIAS